MLTSSGVMTLAAGQAAAAGGPPIPDLNEAYSVCERIARAHYENFPVASRFLPKSSRKALAAVYAFARQADDFADEGYGPGGPDRAARLAAIDDWERRLREAVGMKPASAPGVVPAAEASVRNSRACDENEKTVAPTGAYPHSVWSAGAHADADAIFLALADTIRAHRIPAQLFLDLLSAFRQDVVVQSYASRDELLDYCRRSANPVGRIVLAVQGQVGEDAARWSDAICTGLQLANFWQDVGIDAAKQRIYLPSADRARHGVSERELSAAQASPSLRALVLEETAWTRGFFETGRPLLASGPPALRWHLRLVWHGGVRILEMIEEAKGDVLAHRPKLAKTDLVRMLYRSFTSGGAAGGAP